ncbi:MAG: cytoplasmic iron level regulating protein YaaA (DUF328/UPF0246 family) [Halieaceae bacterium]|jgi:cytoplasmic iron level regulating protein YaaA (DUF328/UPF0246 family)
MLIVISPAKTLDFKTPAHTRKATTPEFIDRATVLNKTLRKSSPEGIQQLMGVSSNIAALTHQRVMNWQPPFTQDNAKQSLLAFKGDVYAGLDADSLTARDLSYAQNHLRILSGLYGVLRPLDLMQPYRLEMGIRLENPGGSNLYQFWGDEITDALNRQLASSRTQELINLASNEYFKAVKPGGLTAEVITPVFKDLKNGKYKVVSFFAKKARGMMTRFAIENRLSKAVQLKDFDGGGYRYNAAESTADRWTFTRDQPH